MDVILNTNFSSAALGRVPLPGFFDNFNRANGDPIGFTSAEGREWLKEALDGSTPSWLINADGSAYLSASSNGHNIATVDGLSPNGTLSTKITKTTSSNRGGLAFRRKAVGDHLAVYQPSGASGVGLYKRVGGVASSMGSSTTLLTVGDVLSVVMLNTSITVKVNGTTVITATDTDFTDFTRHGLYCSSDAISFAMDDARFVATAA